MITRIRPTPGALVESGDCLNLDDGCEVELTSEVPDWPIEGRSVQQFGLAPWAVDLRGSIVVTQETTYPLAAPHAAVLRLNLQAVDHLVAKPLVVALAMVMDHEVGERTPEVSLTQRNQPIQAFSLTDRTKRSACALQFGARNGVRITRTPDVSSSSRTARLHFRSRSQVKTRCPSSTPSSAAVSWRTTWRTKASSGCGVEPTIETRRECSSITNSV
jgi:hypothetical protein